MNKESNCVAVYHAPIMVASTTNRWLMIKGHNHVPVIWLLLLKSAAVSGPIPIVAVVESELFLLLTDRLKYKIHIYHYIHG